MLDRITVRRLVKTQRYRTLMHAGLRIVHKRKAYCTSLYPNLPKDRHLPFCVTKLDSQTSFVVLGRLLTFPMIPSRFDSNSPMMSVGDDSKERANVLGSEHPTETECMDLRPEDVICTKGRITRNHPGNMRYNSLIQQTKERYQACEFRGDKTRITHEIIEAVTQSGGRFLKFHPATRQWSELSPQLRREKVSHALRSSRRSSTSTSDSKQNKKRRASVASTFADSDNGDALGNASTPEENERVQAVYRVQQEILRSYNSTSEDTNSAFDSNMSV